MAESENVKYENILTFVVPSVRRIEKPPFKKTENLKSRGRKREKTNRFIKLLFFFSIFFNRIHGKTIRTRRARGGSEFFKITRSYRETTRRRRNYSSPQ